MDGIIKTVKTLFVLLLFVIPASCTPGETVVQTAIAQTQAAAPTATATGLSHEALVATAVAQTLLSESAAASTASGYQIQTAVVQTLTAIVPTPTHTPLVSPTPVTPTPTITQTHAPYPTITNTPEPFVPSGPITLQSLADGGDNKVSVNWQAEGSFLGGFCVVWSSTNSEPTYPNDYWHRFPDGHTRSAVVEVNMNVNYYFRVCEFDLSGNYCKNYSNVVQFNNQ